MNPVLLDVDADFMLNRDYNWHYLPDDVRNKSKITITGKQLGRVILPFIKNGTSIIMEVDHHESLYWWDCHMVKDAFCIHIDAHHDMWSSFSFSRENAGNREGVDCGNYLQQALFDDVVANVVFVPSPFKGIGHEIYDIRENLDPEIRTSRVQVQSWRVFKKQVHTYPKADIITLCVSPEWFPQQHWQHLQDLAEMLGVRKEVIFSTQKDANQRWNAMKRCQQKWRWGSKGGDFYFPYKEIKSKILKGLQEALKAERAVKK